MIRFFKQDPPFFICDLYLSVQYSGNIFPGVNCHLRVAVEIEIPEGKLAALPDPEEFSGPLSSRSLSAISNPLFEVFRISSLSFAVAEALLHTNMQ